MYNAIMKVRPDWRLTKLVETGFGRFLVLAAIGLVLLVCGIVGCRYFTVDSRVENMSFYVRVGF